MTSKSLHRTRPLSAPRAVLAVCLGAALSQPAFAGSLGDWVIAAGQDSKLQASLGDALWSGFSLSRPMDSSAGFGFSSLTEADHQDWQYQGFKPTLGWQATDSWRVDAGVDVLHAEPRVAHIDAALVSATESGHVQHWQSRYQLGLSYSLSEQTQIDWLYRGAPSTAHTASRLSGSDSQPLLFVSDGQDLASTSLGFNHSAGERWTLLGQYTRFDTSELSANRSVQQVDSDELWHPSWSLSVGSEFRLDPQWSLRGGLQFSQDMRADHNGDITRFAVGAAYRSGNRLSLEMAYTHELIRQQSLSLNNDRVHLDAPDSSMAHRFGLGLRYAF